MEKFARIVKPGNLLYLINNKPNLFKAFRISCYGLYTFATIIFLFLSSSSVNLLEYVGNKTSVHVSGYQRLEKGQATYKTVFPYSFYVGLVLTVIALALNRFIFNRRCGFEQCICAHTLNGLVNITNSAIMLNDLVYFKKARGDLIIDNFEVFMMIWIITLLILTVGIILIVSLFFIRKPSLSPLYHFTKKVHGIAVIPVFQINSPQAEAQKSMEIYRTYDSENQNFDSITTFL